MHSVRHEKKKKKPNKNSEETPLGCEDKGRRVFFRNVRPSKLKVRPRARPALGMYLSWLACLNDRQLCHRQGGLFWVSNAILRKRQEKKKRKKPDSMEHNFNSESMSKNNYLLSLLRMLKNLICDAPAQKKKKEKKTQVCMKGNNLWPIFHSD